MGQFYDILERHMQEAGYRISQRQVAARLGVSPTTLRNWQAPTRLIEKEHLVAIAHLTHVPYHRVLDALLADIGYLNEDDPRMSDTEPEDTARRIASDARRARDARRAGRTPPQRSHPPRSASGP